MLPIRHLAKYSNKSGFLSDGEKIPDPDGESEQLQDRGKEFALGTHSTVYKLLHILKFTSLTVAVLANSDDQDNLEDSDYMVEYPDYDYE